MTLPAILAIALALSLDAFAVAVSTGLTLGTVSGRQAFRLSFHFGLFQFLMPAAGWFLGLTVRSRIEQWDHWVAFLLLALIGLKMVHDAREPSAEGREDREGGAKEAGSGDPTRGISLIMLSLATSIDALAVGLSFSLLAMSVWRPALIIGLVCAAMTMGGLTLGRALSRARVIGRRASLLGGLTLIAIGVKILLEHGALA